MIANAPAATAAISDAAGVPRSFSQQTSRHLRQRGHIPSRRGNTAPQITCEQAALLIVTAACLGPGVAAACDRAEALPRPVLDYLASLVETAWRDPDDPQFDFGSLRVDLTTGSVAIVELTAGTPTTTHFGPTPRSNPASHIAVLPFATIRDVVNTIRSNTKRRVRS